MFTAVAQLGGSRVLAALAGVSLTNANNPSPVIDVHTRPDAPKKSSLVRLTPKVTSTASVPEPEPARVEPTVARDLPVYNYTEISPPPKMRFARTEADVDKWVQELDLTGPISMDCEWVVAFRKNGTRPVSVIQIADKNNIIVVQLRNQTSNMARFPIRLQHLLENPKVPKMGANILNDAKKLFKDYGIMMSNVVELGALARQADPPCTAPDIFGNGRKLVALAKLVERYLQKKLRKDNDNRLGDWEGDSLSSEMLEYAANDAYCGLEVYNHLIALAEANDITLDSARYTSRVHYPCLYSPPALLSADPLPIPIIIHTPKMGDARMLMQQLRAYRYFLARRHLDIDAMCKELRVNTAGKPLQRNTVVAYVIGAIKAWPPFADNLDLAELRLLVQTDLKSWSYNYEWIAKVGRLSEVEQ